MMSNLPIPPPPKKASRSLWSRAIVFFGMLLMASFGLCGLNLIAVLSISGATQAAQQSPVRQAISKTLIDLGYVEVFGILLGIVGVVVSLIGAAIHSILGRRNS